MRERSQIQIFICSLLGLFIPIRSTVVSRINCILVRILFELKLLYKAIVRKGHKVQVFLRSF